MNLTPAPSLSALLAALTHMGGVCPPFPKAGGPECGWSNVWSSLEQWGLEFIQGKKSEGTQMPTAWSPPGLQPLEPGRSVSQKENGWGEGCVRPCSSKTAVEDRRGPGTLTEVCRAQQLCTGRTGLSVVCLSSVHLLVGRNRPDAVRRGPQDPASPIG